ncbi:sialic acid-binding Ig-like lectin 14 [Mustelus asterias]
MIMMKCVPLILMFIQVLHSSRWSVRIPWNVTAVRGSCAEIPCTFDYPDTYSNPRILWLKGGSDPHTRGVSVIYDSAEPGRATPGYRGRIELKGNVTGKQCSLLIKDFRSGDEGDYYIRVKMTSPWNSAENHLQKIPVSLSILEKLRISVPGQLIAGKPARFTCSLTQSCSVPEFKLEWIGEESPILPGALTSQHTRNSLEDSWTVSSTFSFTPSLDQHGESLTCKLISGDGQTTVQESLRLDVQSPMNLCVSDALCKPILNSSIVSVEGSSFLLYCKASGIPPVNLTLSRRGVEISNSPIVELKLFIHNVSSEDEGEYWCEAANNLGTARSSTHISVQYRPTIVSDLNCTSLKNEVHCICRVKANPAANITWNLGGNISVANITWNITGNISEIAPHLLESSLRLTHPTGSENLILCMAQNEHGVSVREYQLDSPEYPERETIMPNKTFFYILGTFPWWIVILIVTAAAIILILIMVKVQRKKTSDIVSVPEISDDSVTYAAVRHSLNTQDQGLGRNIDGPGTASKSAQSEEVLYAALNVSNIHKPEMHLQTEEPNQYAAIKWK